MRMSVVSTILIATHLAELIKCNAMHLEFKENNFFHRYRYRQNCMFYIL